jgi:prepilin-type processing-associated H-X9-DG protein
MRRPSQLAAAGFTIVELLVSIGIIALLVALLLPTVSRAHQSGMAVTCMSNLRQLGGLTAEYVMENDGFVPSNVDQPKNYNLTYPFWDDLLRNHGRYRNADAAFRCPGQTFVDRSIAGPGPYNRSYSINSNVAEGHWTRLNRIKNTSTLLYLVDSGLASFNSYPYSTLKQDDIYARWSIEYQSIMSLHGKAPNVLFFDFHAERGPDNHDSMMDPAMWNPQYTSQTQSYQ